MDYSSCSKTQLFNYCQQAGLSNYKSKNKNELIDLLNVKINSIKDFYNLINLRLKPLREIKEIEILFINKVEKRPN